MIDISLPDVSRQLSRLSEAGFRYIVLHKRPITPRQLEEWQTRLMGAVQSYLVASPKYQDEDVIVYSTAPVVGQDCAVQYDLEAAIGPLRVEVSPAAVAPYETIGLRVAWGATAPPGEDLQVKVSLVDEEGQVGQAEYFEISPSWPTGEWPANTIVWDNYSLQVEPWLKSGPQAVMMSLVRRENGRPVSQAVKVGEVRMLIPERSFAAPPMERESGALFGDALRLLGYDLKVEDDQLHVTLHWQAMRRMNVAYTMFVHLFDPATEKILSQADVMPYGYTYPTTWWEAHEVVSDEIVIQLADVPAGVYRLAVGVYDYGTGKRLPIQGANGVLQPADRLVLAESVRR